MARANYLSTKYYATYGIFILLVSLIAIGFLINLYFSPTTYYGIEILLLPLILPLIISLGYLYIGLKKRTNKLTDLSIKLGFIPSILLVLGIIIIVSLEEFFKITLFPESPLIHIILAILGLIIAITYIIFIIGFFKRTSIE